MGRGRGFGKGRDEPRQGTARSGCGALELAQPVRFFLLYSTAPEKKEKGKKEKKDDNRVTCGVNRIISLRDRRVGIG